ncbi:MAG: glutaredoxin [Gammaproteobacteria bacterium]|nr:glutaredoxin [Gammaproteobacteria bacterium]MEE3133738.1 glutaredoxin domain-containing protein [Pseudomonadota bacterium]|tara:strand:+ start:1523 stop:1801 length:279 start_codon:yes stop_codon:yes gene_type:complete
MTEQYILYQYDSCPYCRRVRQFLDGVDVSVPMRDILLDREAYIDLIRGGGKGTVPCLRIERDTGDVEWLYESADIVDYINAQQCKNTLGAMG